MWFTQLISHLPSLTNTSACSHQLPLPCPLFTMLSKELDKDLWVFHNGDDFSICFIYLSSHKCLRSSKSTQDACLPIFLCPVVVLCTHHVPAYVFLTVMLCSLDNYKSVFPFFCNNFPFQLCLYLPQTHEMPVNLLLYVNNCHKLLFAVLYFWSIGCV